jgi:hypothetical protein
MPAQQDIERIKTQTDKYINKGRIKGGRKGEWELQVTRKGTQTSVYTRRSLK